MVAENFEDFIVDEKDTFARVTMDFVNGDAYNILNDSIATAKTYFKQTYEVDQSLIQRSMKLLTNTIDLVYYNFTGGDETLELATRRQIASYFNQKYGQAYKVSLFERIKDMTGLSTVPKSMILII